jgi:DHA1 family bicyclomycin/chloramphenicol resistance-like MFS transporter
MVAFQAISTDLYLPALPSIALALETDPPHVQLTLSVFLIGFGLSQLVYGPLSDRFGRRPLLIFGSALYVVASIACMLATSVEELIAFRFLQAVGACTGPVLGRAVVRDLFPPIEAARVLAYLAAAMTVAPMLGPILGGWLTMTFGWRSTFAALAVFGLVLLVAITLILPETHHRKDPHATRLASLLRNYQSLFSARAYLGNLLVGACGYSGLFAFISGSPYVLIDVVGLTPRAYGLCFAAAVAGYTTGSFLAGRLGRALGLDRLVQFGNLVTGAAGLAGLALALLLPPSPAAIVAPAALFFAGAGFMLPSAMAGAIGPFPEKAGLASGLLGAVQLGVAAGVGALVTAAGAETAVPIMVAMTAAGLVALLCHRGLLSTPRNMRGRSDAGVQEQ